MCRVVFLTLCTSITSVFLSIGCDSNSDPDSPPISPGSGGADAIVAANTDGGTTDPNSGAGDAVGSVDAGFDSSSPDDSAASGGVGATFDSGPPDGRAETSGTGGTGETGGTGGSVTTGGSGATIGEDPVKSQGCGADSPLSGNFSIDVQGTNRDYIVTVPDNYDTNTPYKLVFAWHGLGGTAEQIASGFFRGGYYGLESRASGTAIFVAGQGLETSNAVGSGPGWDNSGGRDVAFTSAMLDWMRSNYCIDESRVFSVGMSYGGIMSNTVGCSLGGDFRAIAPMSGMGPMTFGGATCVGQVAAWLSHGNTDTVVPFSSGQSSRDHWVTANHCESATTQAGNNGCVAYNGCDEGYPVVWCEFDGGHTVPSFSGEEIWAFFSQF